MRCPLRHAARDLMKFNYILNLFDGWVVKNAFVEALQET
jgi:hypothetical protein